MKIAFNQGCTRDNSTLELDLQLCEKAGFDAIEPRIDKLHQYLASHSLESLAEFFRESRLKPHTINGIYLYEGFLLRKDEREQALLDEIRFAMRVASRIGAPSFIVVPPMNPETENIPYDAPWQRILESTAATLDKLSVMAAEHGLTIGLEMVGSPRCSVRTLAQAAAVVRAVDRSNLGYTLDAFNLYLHEKLNRFDEIRTLEAEKIFAVHLNGAEADLPAADLRQAQRTFCDRGFLDVENFLANVHAAGYAGPAAIEFFREDCWARPAEWVVREAYRTTRAVMEKAGVL